LESLQANGQGGDDFDGKTPAERLQSRGQQISNTLNGRGSNTGASSSAHTLDHPMSSERPMAMTALDLLSPSRSESSLEDSPSRSKNLETVVSFLQAKRDQPINAIEIEGLVSLINKSNAEDDREPFRFSSSSPTPPVRGSTPNYNFGVGASSSMPTVGESARKVLTKNPNGVYRWQGGGSAKPKNRYRSPAFGASQSMPAGLKLSTPSASPSDSKRRRVGEEASQSISIASHVQTPSRSAAPSPAQIPSTAAVPFPVTPGTPSPNVNRATSPTKAGTNNRSPLTARPSIPPKITAPAHPSPLRQAWGAQSDTSSSPSSSPGPSKPTNAATFMAELIKDVTPPKRPDLSNPYQTASPVKPRAPVARKIAKKRTRATGKPTLPTETAQDDATPQAAIEATIPKGSKRQRPPSNLERPVNGHKSSFSANEDDMDVDELDSDRAPSPPKKQKKAMVNGNGLPSIARATSADAITVKDIDVDDDSPTPSTPILKPAEIIEPQSDGLSRQPTVVIPPAPTNGSSFFSSSSTGRTSGGSGSKSSLPKEPSKLRFSYKPDVSMSSEGSTSAPSTPKPAFTSLPVQDSKQRAMSAAAEALPVFSFGLATPSSSAGAGKRRAESSPAASLPTFDLNAPPVASTSKLASSSSGFNWSAAGMAPPKSSSSSWTCDQCSLSNDASHMEKCSVCDAPKPGAVAPSTNGSGGFNWAAAGIAPPKAADDASWTCKVCGLSNAASHTEKCSVCDEPKPGAKAVSSGSGGGFNWSAAGIAPPTKESSKWMCSTCGLSNPATATEKCIVCDASK
jgi:rubrerythrin